MALPGPSDTPQELIDEIIDHCSGDKRTLIACSLTCKAWVHRTRKHLFSKLTLTDETLLIWCGYVETSAWKPQSLSDIYPPVPSSHPPYRLASHVTSLQVVPKYSPNSPKSLGVVELYRAKLHLSAFTQLKSLALTAVSFASFDSAPLEACFGSLAETVRGLKLSMCILDEMRFFAFLRLFTRLESLEVNGNVWPSGRRAGTAKALQKDLPTLRGSFTVSGFTDSENGLLDSLVTTRVEYHTITLGHNPPLAFPKLNALFAKCKDHLRTLSLTAPERISRYSGSRGLLLDLSPCENLVEIHARFYHAEFEKIIPMLKTVASPRFRKLKILTIPPIPAIRTQDWTKLDEEVTALVKRVNATTATDRLEVLFCSYSTGLGKLVLSDLERALPRIASNARVSLRAENLPFFLNQ